MPSKLQIFVIIVIIGLPNEMNKLENIWIINV